MAERPKMSWKWTLAQFGRDVRCLFQGHCWDREICAHCPRCDRTTLVTSETARWLGPRWLGGKRGWAGRRDA